MELADYIVLQKTCRDELSLVKLSKDLQAPIEFSTYDQIREIVKSGKYYFGSKRFRIFISTEEIIKLRVKNSTSSKQTYTLTELQELESKIVLIRDHRSPSDKLSADEIECFLNVRNICMCKNNCVCHIVNMYVCACVMSDHEVIHDIWDFMEKLKLSIDSSTHPFSVSKDQRCQKVAIFIRILCACRKCACYIFYYLAMTINYTKHH